MNTKIEKSFRALVFLLVVLIVLGISKQNGYSVTKFSQNIIIPLSTDRCFSGQDGVEIKLLESNEWKKYAQFDKIQAMFMEPLKYNKTIIEYLPNYRSPCYYKLTREGGPEVTCLPSFFLAGFPKCASSDLHARITRHKYVNGGNHKENYWMSHSCGKNKTKLAAYTQMYRNASHLAQELTITNSEGEVYHPLAIGDFTPISTHYMPYLDIGITSANCIRNILPDAKVIISMRNPVTRVLSGYKFKNRRDPKFSFSAEEFHQNEKAQIEEWKRCVDYQQDGHLCKQLYMNEVFVSIYYNYVSEWLKVIPRENILFVRFEDYIREPEEYLNTVIFPFLELDPFTKEEMVKLHKEMHTREPNTASHMLNKTRTMLEEFYKPYNKQLAELLHDNKYLWEDEINYG